MGDQAVRRASARTQCKFTGPLSGCSAIFREGTAQVVSFRMGDDERLRTMAMPAPLTEAAREMCRQFILTHAGDVVEMTYATCHGRISRIRTFRNLSLEIRRKAER